MNFTVMAIVVTYNTDDHNLRSTLLALTQQCRVIVIDNSDNFEKSKKIKTFCLDKGINILILGGNFGIAYAQNRGIIFARENGATDILLMDDDSVANPTLVNDLLRARMHSIIQPVVASARTVSSTGEELSNRSIKVVNGLIPCSELTSSGTLIPITVFDQVGYFDEGLFIDCVDFEWGWRVKEKGIPMVICSQVTIEHRLGEGRKFGIRIPSPIRHYYQYRNIIRIILRSKAPLSWRISQSIKLPVKLVLIFILMDRSFLRLKYATQGIIDAIKGYSGKIRTKH